ncbi:MAG TPA: MBG domain-containing protein, partial [Gammaproteobacteria bacterium]|nr:MBG domain-containing protein [Gammaproteobacteria bacterium]
SYNITSGTFSSASSNYSAPTLNTGNSPALTITQAGLTASLNTPAQTKVYGADDPSVSGIAISLNGLINRTVTNWMNGTTNINDSGLTSSVVSLARQSGENVGSYNITSGTFSSASSNYSAPTLNTGNSPTLGITTAGLTASLNTPAQTKVYGADDPSVSGIAVSLNGLINRTVTNWMNGTTNINDSGLTSSVVSLVRQSGENVGSYNITSGVFTAPSSNYFAPGFAGSPTLSITQAGLSGSIANQNKVYGTNDPLLSGINVNLAGLINRTVSTWNGNVAVNDSALTSSVTSLVRATGESVGSYGITSGVFTAPSANYLAPTFTGSPTLNITKAGLTGSIANQSKVYGTDDPSLTGIAVTLNGIINNPAIVTWNGNVSVNDTGNVATTLASLTRATGENVGSYGISAATFNALTGSASGNYNAPTYTGVRTLTIDPANLTGSIANQNKVYGENDPSLAGIIVTLGGRVNTSVTNWMGGVTAINDTGNVNGTLTALSRNAGEAVNNYAINTATFILSGSSAGNYNSIVPFIGSPILTISKANLTGSIANQSKLYGANDPAVSGIGVNLVGLINNNAISTWNGTVSINDSALTSSVTSLARLAGENIGLYGITGGVFAAPSGNYNAPGFTGSPTLTITPVALTATIPNQTKVYGTGDPLASSISATLLGNIQGVTVTNWNSQQTSINDNVGSALAAYGRNPGENVGNYAITTAVFNPLTGTGAGNYTAPTTFTNNPVLGITPASLTISGVAANNKIFNGTTAATLNTSSAALSGVLGIDIGNVLLAGGGNGLFANAAVASNIPVTATSIPLTGSASGNYSLIMPTGLSADILPGPTPPPTPTPTPGPTPTPVDFLQPVIQVIMPDEITQLVQITHPVTYGIPVKGSVIHEGRHCTVLDAYIAICGN